MRCSYKDFINLLRLADTELAKILYHLYLDCLNEMAEKDDKQLDQYGQYYRVDKINFLSTLFFTIYLTIKKYLYKIIICLFITILYKYF